MPVITQGRKQFIVPIDILFGWKKYNKKYPNAHITYYDKNYKVLTVNRENKNKLPPRIVTYITGKKSGRHKI